ncbi:DUF6461 domain-containing protein [Nocardioides plantarum]|uniref:DUF6461 domain-containing protein n=1 Tax=Nocardioides plantarum TaxID=29299 RepID=A0ABV5KEY6_9ACTN|nr:DUF6461 domain-containing protein [Nocardioides plantarum]
MTLEDYAWVNDSHLEQAACFSIVPAADRDAALAAFGARAVLDPETEDIQEAAFDREVIQVVEVGDALVVIEDNGFQGTRPEVLGPLSLASASGVAAAFFWNVNALTDFTAARNGVQEFAIELLGPIEADDEDLLQIPATLHPLISEGTADDGDNLAAGLALIAAHTGVSFGPEVLDAGTWYALEPTPSAPRTYTQSSSYDPLGGVLPGASPTIYTLSPDEQRAVAEWASRAAVRESGLSDDPIVTQVLAGLGTGSPAPVVDGLDELARTTTAAHDHFTSLEHRLESGGHEMPSHPFHEARVSTWHGDVRAISHLEGSYLGQRRWAVEALRDVSHHDAYSAALSCLSNASVVFELGRTTRDWTFREDTTGRWREDTKPNPRHQAFLQVVADLVADLSSSQGRADPAVWARADAALPEPLTESERRAAIHADAEADAQGEFSTYQIASSEDDDMIETTWSHGMGVSGPVVPGGVDGVDALDEDEVRNLLKDMLRHEGATASVLLEVDDADQLFFSDFGDEHGPLAQLDTELRRLDALLLALTRPVDVLTAIAEADHIPQAIDRLCISLSIDESQARAILGMRFQRATREDVGRLRAERDAVAAMIDQMRPPPAQ